MGKIITKKDFDSLVDIEKDIIAHPDEDLDYIHKLFQRGEISDADMSAIRSAYDKIINNPNLNEGKKVDLMKNGWKVNFKQKPPTPQEFLLSQWLGPAGEEMFEYKKQIFFDFFDITTAYRNLILYLPIGWGKSTFSLVLLLYVATHIYLMREPYKYLNVQQSSYIVTAIVAFSQDKANEIITTPLKDVIQGSEKFVKCKTTEILERNMKEGDPTKIYWTTAGEGSVIRIGNIRFKQISDTGNLLGLSIINAIATELTFFKEKGWSDAKIMKLYNKVKGRVYSRFQDSYYARTILDSSPDSLDNDIDTWIIEESKKEKTNYLVRGTKWYYQPWQFKEWERTGDTFPVYKGTASNPPRILSSGETDNYNKEDIIDFPIDIKDLAINDLQETLKDYAGEPSNARDKLIHNHQLIENIFVENLTNIYTYIHAPANLPPEDLIWDKIKDKFFIKVKDSYQFYRHPSAKRYIAIDQSEVNDWTGIAMSHVELNTKGELVFVTDFAITIIPGPSKERINLEAIKFFIRDLRKKGGIDIGNVSFDQFQSSSTIQFLDRLGINIEKLSVDSSTEPYLEYIAKMKRGTVKMGKSIIMKNNLKSLIMGETKIKKRKKVEHVLGDMEITDNKDWKTSKLGYFGKDLSDAVVASVYLADKNGTKAPQIIWKDVGRTKEEVHDNMKSEMKASIKDKILGTSASRFLK